MSSFRPRATARSAAAYRRRAARARTEELRNEYERYAEVLENTLAAAHRCKRCGRQLENAVSIKRGYGNECFDRADEGSPTTEGATH